jgi:hypothetical protein
VAILFRVRRRVGGELHGTSMYRRVMRGIYRKSIGALMDGVRAMGAGNQSHLSRVLSLGRKMHEPVARYLERRPAPTER